MKKILTAAFPIKQYKGFTMQSVTLREGGLNVLKYPSRFANTLYYPDGKVIKDSNG